MATRERPSPQVRTRGLKLLRRLTFASAAAGAAGVGIFGWVSAATIPGKSLATTQQSTVSTSSSASSNSFVTPTPAAVATPAPTLQAPVATPTPASSGSAVTVSGGSH